jgi:hypothetical protein
MKTSIRRSVIPLFALAALATAPARADAVGGSGAAYGVKVGSESVTIFQTFDGGRLVLHLRNVGSRSVAVEITPTCNAGAGACAPARRISVDASARDGDASQDRTVTLPGSTQSFAWTISI